MPEFEYSSRVLRPQAALERQEAATIQPLMGYLDPAICYRRQACPPTMFNPLHSVLQGSGAAPAREAGTRSQVLRQSGSDALVVGCK